MRVHCEGLVRIKRKTAFASCTRYAVLHGTQLTFFQAVTSRRIDEYMDIESGRINSRVPNAFEVVTTTGQVLLLRVLTKADLARWLTAFHQLAALQGEDAHQRHKKKWHRPMRHSLLPSRPSPPPPPPPTTEDAMSPSGIEDFDAVVMMAMSPIPTIPPPHEPAEPEKMYEKDSNNSNSNSNSKNNKRRVSFFDSVHVRVIPTVRDEDVQHLFYNQDEMKKFSARADSILCRTGEVMSCALEAMRRSSSRGLLRIRQEKKTTAQRI